MRKIILKGLMVALVFCLGIIPALADDPSPANYAVVFRDSYGEYFYLNRLPNRYGVDSKCKGCEGFWVSNEQQ